MTRIHVAQEYQRAMGFYALCTFQKRELQFKILETSTRVGLPALKKKASQAKNTWVQWIPTMKHPLREREEIRTIQFRSAGSSRAQPAK